MLKKILIDGRFIGIGDSVGRVTLEVLRNVLKIDDKNQYSVLIRPAGEKLLKEYGLWENPKLKVEILDIPHYSPAEQSKLLVWLNKKPYDLVHFMQFNHPILYRKPFVVTIHDLTTYGYLYLESFLKSTMYKKTMKSAVFNSKKIITVSETSKKEICEYFPVSAEKIAVTLLAVDENYLRVGQLDINSRRKLGDKFKKHYQIEDKYLLYTGMWKRHKNLKRLLEAFQKLKANSYQLSAQLVLAGKVDKNEPDIIKEIEKINQHPIEEIKSNDPVFVAGFVPEELLPAAYAGAVAYVTASLNEGFGLPPLESIACGTPAVASNLTAFPEILGEAAIYFDPYDEKDIAKKMLEIVENQNLRISLQKKGVEQIKKYSWQKTAEKTLAVYKEVLGEK